MDPIETLASEAPARPEERRQSPRQTLITEGWLLRENSQAAPQRVMLADVSVMGVGFESEAPIEPGSNCEIRIQSGPMRISWRVRVVFCGKIEGGPYRLGGQLLPVEAEEFASFTDSDLNSLLILDD